MNDILKIVLSLSLSGSIIAIILFAIKPFLKNRLSKTWQYYIWLVIILRLLVPITSEISILNGLFNPTDINASIPIYNITQKYQTSNTSSSYQTVDEKPLTETANENLLNKIETSENNIKNGIVNNNTISTITFDRYLYYMQEYGWFVWLFVSVILLLKKIISYHVYVRYIKSKRKLITDESIISTFNEVCDKAGIKREIGIYSYKMINSPMLIGFIKPYILLPETILSTTDGLKHILSHELIHYKRMDFLYKWLVEITVCVHFFNPIIYFVRKYIHKDCEFSCDEMVIKTLDEQSKKAYGTAIINALESSAGFKQHAISSMLCEDIKITKERLGAIMKYKKSSKIMIVFNVFLTVMLSLGAVFTGVSAHAEVTEPKNLPKKDLVMSSETGKDLVMSTETEKDLQNISAIKNATIDAYSYNGKWADGKGITSDTYKRQLDEKIKYIEALYKEKKEKFVIFENVSETEIANTAGIKYMFNNSTVYQNMVTVTDSLFVNSKDRAFTSSYDGEKEYERSVFYIDESARLALKLDYTLSKGKLSIYVVSPKGEIVYQNKSSKQFSETINLSLDKGLWSIILINEYEDGQIYGEKGISGYITYPKEQSPLIEDGGYKPNSSYMHPEEQIDINLPSIKVSGYENYGPYNLKKGDVVSSDLKWSNTEAGIYLAIGTKYNDFNGFKSRYGGNHKEDIVVQEDGLYYVFIGNPSTVEPDVKGISGNITINSDTIPLPATNKM